MLKMSLLSKPPPSFFFFPKTPILHHHHVHTPFSSFSLHPSLAPHLSLSSNRSSSRTFLSSSSTFSSDEDDEWGPDPKPKPNPSSVVDPPEFNVSVTAPDEWGEKPGPGPDSEPETLSKFTEPDPPINEDEEERAPLAGDGEEGKISSGESRNLELKRCLVETLYGSEFGFRASSEVRAEVSELVNQLEAVNPFPNPTEVPGLLDGNWVLVRGCLLPTLRKL